MSTAATPWPNTLPLAHFPQRARRTQSIAEEIRTLIVEGHLPIGSKLPTESVLCQQFGVSRTTLREAVQMLRSTGLLDVTPGRGSYVRAPSLQLLLPSLQLAAHGRGLQGTDVGPLLGLLHQHALTGWQGQIRQREALQNLYQHTLPRQATATEAANAEANWHLAVLQLAQDPLLGFFGQLLLALGAPARVKKYANPDELTRTTQLQLRINGALMEGDSATALRTLGLWCGLNAAAPTSQAKVA